MTAAHTATPIHDELLAATSAVPAPAEATVAPDAEGVVARAWSAAQEHGHARFGTGHVLLGIAEAEGAEAGLLAAAGVTASSAGAALALVASSSVTEPVVPAAPGEDGTPLPGEAIAELLAGAGRTAEHDVITTADLLRALLAAPWGQAAEMLAALGVDQAELVTALAALTARPAPSRALRRPRDPGELLSSAHHVDRALSS